MTPRSRPERVRIRLLQHAGKPAAPVVATGRPGEGRARRSGVVAAEDLGANVHASIDGTVSAVTDSYVEIAR